MKAKRSPKRITRAQRERGAVTRILISLRALNAALSDYTDATRKPVGETHPFLFPNGRRRKRAARR